MPKVNADKHNEIIRSTVRFMIIFPFINGAKRHGICALKRPKEQWFKISVFAHHPQKP